jgi:hypothetical protein
MVPVVGHQLEDRCLLVSFTEVERSNLERKDLCTLPMVDGAFYNGALHHIALIGAESHFGPRGEFWQEWSAEGKAAESLGPYVLDGQEFELRALLEHIYKKETR